MPDRCADGYVTGVLPGPCEAWEVMVFVAMSALPLHFSARCDLHVQEDAKLAHLPPYGVRTGCPAGASLRRRGAGCGTAPPKMASLMYPSRKQNRPPVERGRRSGGVWGGV